VLTPSVIIRQQLQQKKSTHPSKTQQKHINLKNLKPEENHKQNRGSRGPQARENTKKAPLKIQKTSNERVTGTKPT